MSRFQLSLNVRDVDRAVDFYTKFFGVEPAKHRPGYANFVVADPPLKLVIIEEEGEPGSINHVGIEVDGTEAVISQTRRFTSLGLAHKIDETHTCCYATQDKVWTRDPDGVPWETYTVLAATEEFGARADDDCSLCET
jgi:catechol 2,3-dioxygenase-like lactoylglutathione lyase family enzyme